MQNFIDNEFYLISGATSAPTSITTGIMGTRFYNNSTYHYYGTNTGSATVSGDIFLQGRVTDDSPFITFFSTNIKSATGNYINYSNITWNSVRGIVIPTGGNITIAARIQS